MVFLKWQKYKVGKIKHNGIACELLMFQSCIKTKQNKAKQNGKILAWGLRIITTLLSMAFFKRNTPYCVENSREYLERTTRIRKKILKAIVFRNGLMYYLWKFANMCVFIHIKEKK